MALIPWWIRYPNVNDEIMNLDWLLRVSNENTEKISNFINLNTIKYADPILWDITSQYEANTVTVDTQTGDAYISTKAVPFGVSLSNTNYWTKIYNYASELDTLRSQIAVANEHLSPTATAPRTAGTLVWLNGLLYEVTEPMIEGDRYVEGSNCDKVTIEGLLKILNEYVGYLPDLETTDKSNLVAAINEVLTSLGGYIGNIPDLETTDKSNLVAAINELYEDVNPLYKRILTVGSRGCDYTSITDAVNAAKTYSSVNQRTAILITSGTYNEEITLTNNGIDLIGLGKPVITYGSTYPNAPLNVYGSVHCSNIYFNNTNPSGNSYGVHYEAQGDISVIGADVTFDDCIFVSNAAPALGMGMGDGMTARFTNCEFYCNKDGERAVYFHNLPQGVDFAQTAEFYNCQLNVTPSVSSSVVIDNSRALQSGAKLSPMAVKFVDCKSQLGHEAIAFRAATNITWPYVPESGEVSLSDGSVGNNMLGLNYNEKFYTVKTFATLPTNQDYTSQKSVIFINTRFDPTFYFRRIKSVTINSGDYTASFSIKEVTHEGVAIETTNTTITGYYATVELEFSLSDFS